MSPPDRSWLPAGFRHPERVELACGMHIRPIRGSDVEIDYPAVMGSRELLWDKYGDAWGWPPATMTLEGDREDLEHHEREIAEHKSFNYAVLDADETRLLGCIYLDPPRPADEHDVMVSWWVVEDQVDSALDAELAAFVPRWVTTDWPFSRPHYGV
jgi:RimJ/RimL family protein N-acetyltransferase